MARPADRERPTVGWLWRAFAFVVVAARWLILLAWIGAAVAVTVYLPPLTASNALGGLIPALGIVIDTFVVRSLLVPALVVLFGRVGSWPGRTARHPVRPAPGTRAAPGIMFDLANAGERERA